MREGGPEEIQRLLFIPVSCDDCNCLVDLGVTERVGGHRRVCPRCAEFYKRMKIMEDMR